MFLRPVLAIGRMLVAEPGTPLSAAETAVLSLPWPCPGIENKYAWHQLLYFCNESKKYCKSELHLLSLKSAKIITFKLQFGKHSTKDLVYCPQTTSLLCLKHLLHTLTSRKCNTGKEN